ncbi:MAG: class I SAM-dependent methyltransferase [Gemmatimonadaceae bacterium]
MFRHTSAFYDLVYREKDYASESRAIRAVVEERVRAPEVRLLDVACGTGAHLAHLREAYAVEGIELDEGMLGVARRRLPNVPLHHGDMMDFELPRRFDTITCLFSSIGYVRSLPKLRQAVRIWTKHLAPGGILIVEPWIFPESFRDGHVAADLVTGDGITVARVGTSEVIEDGRVSVLHMQYLIASADGIRHEVERHELALFSRHEYAAAFGACGLDVEFEVHGLTGRGLFIATGRPRRLARTVYWKGTPYCVTRSDRHPAAPRVAQRAS